MTNLPASHDGALLKQYLRQNKIRQEDFAADLEISRNHLLTKLKEFAFKKEFKNKVITLLDLEPGFFEKSNVPVQTYDQGAAGSMLAEPDVEYKRTPVGKGFNSSLNQPQGVPYYDVDFTEGYDRVFNDQSIQPNFYLDLAPFNDCDVWINFSGSSMAPLITHGDIVALKRVENWKQFLLEGEIYAVVTGNGFRTIKIIAAGKDQDHYTLIPANKGEEFRPQSIAKELIAHVFRVKGNIRRFF